MPNRITYDNHHDSEGPTETRTEFLVTCHHCRSLATIGAVWYRTRWILDRDPKLKMVNDQLTHVPCGHPIQLTLPQPRPTERRPITITTA